MGEKVTRKITGSKGMLEELRADARYTLIEEEKTGENEYSITVEYEKENIVGGARGQEKSDRVELTVPEALLKGYLARGYKVVAMSPAGGRMVHAILER